MYKAVLLQLLATLIAASFAGIWMGMRGGLSALIGGAAYTLPNLLFAIRLSAAAARSQVDAVTFVVGESIKIVATLVILAVAIGYCDVHWISMLVGLFVALKANMFAFLLKT